VQLRWSEIQGEGVSVSRLWMKLVRTVNRVMNYLREPPPTKYAVPQTQSAGRELWAVLGLIVRMGPRKLQWLVPAAAFALVALRRNDLGGSLAVAGALATTLTVGLAVWHSAEFANRSLQVQEHSREFARTPEATSDAPSQIA
jgi:hypothetical protein